MLDQAEIERWPPRAITDLEQRFRELRELVQNSHDEKYDDTRDWLARLLVIRACGYLEQVVLEVQVGYIARKSGGLVRSFAHSWLEKTNNPTPDRLLQTIGRYDDNLRHEFDAFLQEDDAQRFRELTFLVSRRNKIAHGGSEGIGPSRALRLADLAVEIADWFILRMRPS